MSAQTVRKGGGIETMNHDKIQEALRTLRAAGVPVAEATGWVEGEVARHEMGVPTEGDLRWVALDPLPLHEHVAGDRRPILSCALADGRAYELSPAQRDVMRSRFTFTPAKWVEVVEFSTFPNSRAVRKVVLKSVEHVDPRRRALLQRVTITSWGEFMSACLTRETEIAIQKEVDACTARVVRVLARAKEEGVVHGLRTAGGVGHELHAACETKGFFKVDDTKERNKKVREELRTILVSHGEARLADLVEEPKIPSSRQDELELMERFLDELENNEKKGKVC